MSNKAKVNIPPMADPQFLSKDYRLFVNGMEVPCYQTFQFTHNSTQRSFGRQVTENHFALFDFEGEVKVEVVVLNTKTFDPQNVVMRPLALGFKPAVKGNRITFFIKKPSNFTVEPYGVWCPLEIMANPIEDDVPNKNDEKTIVFSPGTHKKSEFTAPEGYTYYFEPGVHYIDPVDLKSGQTVYLAGGALINTIPQEEHHDPWYNQHGICELRQKPTFCCDGAENIKLIGRGIISGRDTFKSSAMGEFILFKNSKNIKVEGIILLEAFCWCAIFSNNTDVLISNVKVFSYYMSSDGFCITGGSRTTVRDCYVHNADDAFFVKGWLHTMDIRFYNCTVWSNMSDPFGIVHEIPDVIEKVLFKDCTCIHYTAPYYHDQIGGAITISLYYGGKAKDIVFDGIVVEESTCPLPIIMFTCWGDKPGYIENITLNNVRISNAVNDKIKIQGDKVHIKNIRFNKVYINGKLIERTNDDDFSFYDGAGETIMITNY